MQQITRLLFRIVFLLSFHSGYAQAGDSISREYISETLHYLASDRLRGRVNFTAEQLEAAEFISREFTRFGLEPFPGMQNFYVPFSSGRGEHTYYRRVEWNGKRLQDSRVVFFPHSLSMPNLSLSDFLVLRTDPPLADSLLYYNWTQPGRNLLLWLVMPDSADFDAAFRNVKIPTGIPASAILITGSNEPPENLNLITNKPGTGNTLYNVVGVLHGKSLPEQAILFSAHYDHVNRGLDGETGGIFNGANDDASGTTAVLALARYYAMRKDNERTLIFSLFAGEELGLLGSKYFVNLVRPENITAMINVEMIGKTNLSGRNAFTVIGSQHSDLHSILRKNLKGTAFKVKEQFSDPRNLFRRSDHFPFADKGIPAHTLMCSDDQDPCYHHSCDDADRIDIKNMTAVIRAIAVACTSLVSGADTPNRINW